MKQKWAESCHAANKPYRASSLSGEGKYLNNKEPDTATPEGWALKSSKKSVRFSRKVKDHLLKIFDEGEKTGIKANPQEVFFRLRNARNRKTGTKLFQKSEWLTAQQITSYFGRLSALNKAGKLQQLRSANQMLQEHPVEETEQEEVNVALEIVNRSKLRKKVMRKLACQESDVPRLLQC